MGDANLEGRKAVAAALAREAGALARRSFRDPSIVTNLKSPGEIVTSTDHAIDRLIAERLAAAYPEDGRISEESVGNDAAGLWVIDPIDGTTNFARGIPHFAVSIAFCLKGQTEIGAIYDPMADDLFIARRGHGAERNGTPIHVSAADRPSALVEIGYSSAHPTAAYIGLIDRLLTGGYAFCHAGSAALGLAYVADGRTDAYCELSLYAWDVLAGLLIVREAGGWISDFPTRAPMANAHPVLAGAPDLVDSLRALTGIG